MSRIEQYSALEGQTIHAVNTKPLDQESLFKEFDNYLKDAHGCFKKKEVDQSRASNPDPQEGSRTMDDPLEEILKNIRKLNIPLGEKMELVEFYSDPWWPVLLEMKLYDQPKEYRICHMMHH